ncbi:MAG: IS30 family transposase [Bacteroidota bacterium]
MLKDWSPEQISGYAKRHNLFSISHERIYQFILIDKQKGGDLYKHLRHQNKKYRKRYGSPKRNGPIRNRRFIDERPAVVEEKHRIGDWEIDTIIGKDRKHSVVSIVERKSKFTLLKKISARTASQVTGATIKALKPFLENVHTITGDNGSEFAHHEQIAKKLKADFYFAHPYSSWERGLNENTNGLVRQYLKKGSDFSKVTGKLLYRITESLNNRPRKTLQFKTPNEIFYAGI